MMFRGPFSIPPVRPAVLCCLLVFVVRQRQSSHHHRHFGARKDVDQYSEVYDEYEQSTCRQSTLEIYRQRAMSRKGQGGVAAAGPSSGDVPLLDAHDCGSQRA